MRLLPDTHAFLWFATADARLSPAAAAAIRDANNTVFLSIASWWEMCLKVGKRKLDLAPGWQTSLPQRMAIERIEWLHIEARHCERTIQLAALHGDPFDRMLAAQALEETLTLVTVDPLFAGYGVPVLW